MMKPNDAETDDFYEQFKWPNEKMLWYRLIACVLVGFAAATGLFMLGVMIANEILEK